MLTAIFQPCLSGSVVPMLSCNVKEEPGRGGIGTVGWGVLLVLPGPCLCLTQAGSVATPWALCSLPAVSHLPRGWVGKWISPWSTCLPVTTQRPPLPSSRGEFQAQSLTTTLPACLPASWSEGLMEAWGVVVKCLLEDRHCLENTPLSSLQLDPSLSNSDLLCASLSPDQDTI